MAFGIVLVAAVTLDRGSRSRRFRRQRGSPVFAADAISGRPPHRLTRFTLRRRERVRGHLMRRFGHAVRLDQRRPEQTFDLLDQPRRHRRRRRANEANTWRASASASCLPPLAIAGASSAPRCTSSVSIVHPLEEAQGVEARRADLPEPAPTVPAARPAGHGCGTSASCAGRSCALKLQVAAMLPADAHRLATDSGHASAARSCPMCRHHRHVGGLRWSTTGAGCGRQLTGPKLAGRGAFVDDQLDHRPLARPHRPPSTCGPARP